MSLAAVSAGPLPGSGSFVPVSDRIGDRRCRCHPGAGGRELLIMTRLPGGDYGETPHVEEAPQPLVTGRVVRSVDRLVALAEELLVLSFGGSLKIISGSAGSSVGHAVP